MYSFPKAGVMMTVVIVCAVACCMIVGHELAHVATTVLVGGRFDGVVFRHVWAVGVRIRIDHLTPTQVFWTLAAAPLAELGILGSATLFDPTLSSLFLVMGLAQWGLNLVPWPGLPNDGHRMWAILRGRSCV